MWKCGKEDTMVQAPRREQGRGRQEDKKEHKEQGRNVMGGMEGGEKDSGR